jgi:hypothetical protein
MLETSITRDDLVAFVAGELNEAARVRVLDACVANRALLNQLRALQALQQPAAQLATQFVTMKPAITRHWSRWWLAVSAGVAGAAMVAVMVPMLRTHQNGAQISMNAARVDRIGGGSFEGDNGELFRGKFE